MKKCKKCGAPLEGFLYKTIGKLMGIKPSAKDPELCNKCEEDLSKKESQTEEKNEPMTEMPAEPMPKPEMPAEPSSAPEMPKAEPSQEAEKKEEIPS